MVKKSNRETILAIHEALNVKRAITINQVAEKAGVAWVTAKNWVDLLLEVQELPKIIVVHTEGDPLYKRERQAGRPRKE